MSRYEILIENQGQSYFPKVTGLVVGWFGVRKVDGRFQIDHLATGRRLNDIFESIDEALIVCYELTAGDLDWGFTRKPIAGRAWWLKFQRAYDDAVRVSGE